MNGIIVLNKPQGITSFDAIRRLRNIIKEKKVGHTGTLDPLATGVLPVMIGRATRFIELLPVSDKSYRAKILLGKTTDTLDSTGKVLSETTPDCTPDKFKTVMADFIGEIEQVPPMYSAIQKDGVRLYELARQGIEIEREARKITIYNIDFLGHYGNEYEIRVDCSAGTYIRSLAADIGEKLGCGAIITELERLSANGFTKAYTLEEIEEAVKNNKLNEIIIDTDKALTAYDDVVVSVSQAKRFKNGGELFVNRLKKKIGTGLYRVYSPDNVFLGIGENSDGELLKIRKNF